VAHSSCLSPPSFSARLTLLNCCYQMG
jgi:hypothetical protein